jgi:photosystem II stability/assembly factor-like uncharacterized protein
VSDRPDPFEEELRNALRSGSEGDKTGGDDDDTLDRIHRGAERRRRRRRSGAVVVAAALAGTIVVGAPALSPTPDSHRTVEPAGGVRTIEPTTSQDGAMVRRRPDVRTGGLTSGRAEGFSSPPKPPRLRAGEPVGVKDLQVASVSGSAPDRFWVSGSGTCAGRTCNVLGIGDASGDSVDVEYTALPGSARQVETTVRFSGDGNTGWATNGAATFSTINGGRDWNRLKQPKGVRVMALEAWGDEAWAVGYRSTTQRVVLATREGSDKLTELTQAPDIAVDQAVTLGEHSFGVATETVGGEFLRTADSGGQWSRDVIGCKPADVSATSGAVWALCGGPTPELVKSSDQGATWAAEPLSMPTSDRPYIVAGIDDDTAFVASDSESWVVDRSVPKPVEGLGGGPYRYIGFTSSDVGYVVDGFGNLCRTEDGGQSWDSVDLP